MFAWFSPLGQIKHHMKKTFVKGTRFKDTYGRSNVFTHTFFTNCKGKWFFTTKSARFSKTFVVPHHLF